MNYRSYFEAEFGMIEGYDHGEMTYEECYRLSFRSAQKLAYGLDI